MSGRYRDMVDVQQRTNAIGKSVPEYGSNLYSDVPCEVDAVGGGETYRGKQLEAHVQYVVTMHLMENVKPDMRLYVTGGFHEGRYLNITRVMPQRVAGRASTMQLHCTETPVIEED